MSLTIDEIHSWDADEMARRLTGPAEDVAEILATAARAGTVEAQALYGQILLDGQGVDRNPAEALRWFGMAAKAGNAMAMNMVGRCAEHGWGTLPDPVRAAQWYGAAAERGLDWGMYNLATLYCLGQGVAQDRATALALYRRAAALGHVKSINMIGGFYEDGWVVDRDMAQAAEFYRQAAEGGDFRGCFNHARMLALAGETSAACDWLRRVPDSATPAFMDKMRGWLRGQDDQALVAMADEL